MSYKSKYTGLQIDDILDSVEGKQNEIEDLDSIRAGAAKGATALQSYTEKYTGTITGVSANGTSVATSGVANIPAASTSAYGVTKLSSATNSTSTTLAATASAVKAAYDLANGKQDKLVSGTNIKTINGESILGSGDITISGEGDYLPSTGGVIDGDLSVIGTITSPTLIMASGGVQGYLRSSGSILGIDANEDIVWGKEGPDSYCITAKGDGTKFLSDDGTYKTISGVGSSNANVQAVDTGDVIDDVNVDYTTKTYVDGLVGDINSTIGDINSILESIINGGVSVITFTIDGTEYQAEEGMTWEQWVNSKYNISGMYLGDDRHVRNSDGLLIAAQGVAVYSTDPIIAGYIYHFMTQDSN